MGAFNGFQCHCRKRREEKKKKKPREKKERAGGEGGCPGEPGPAAGWGAGETARPGRGRGPLTRTEGPGAPSSSLPPRLLLSPVPAAPPPRSGWRPRPGGAGEGGAVENARKGPPLPPSRPGPAPRPAAGAPAPTSARRRATASRAQSSGRVFQICKRGSGGAVSAGRAGASGAGAGAAAKLPAWRPRSPCCGRLAAPAGQEELLRRLPRLRLAREGKGRAPPHPDPPARGSTPGPTPAAYPRPGAGSSPARREAVAPPPTPPEPPSLRRCPRGISAAFGGCRRLRGVQGTGSARARRAGVPWPGECPRRGCRAAPPGLAPSAGQKMGAGRPPRPCAGGAPGRAGGQPCQGAAARQPGPAASLRGGRSRPPRCPKKGRLRHEVASPQARRCGNLPPPRSGPEAALKSRPRLQVPLMSGCSEV